MARLSRCGIDCDICRYRTEKDCPGCRESDGRIFWGTCELHQCSAEKQLPHCGKCESFPCAKLKEWASGENPERINNLRRI